jgi:hypothetical protein
MPLKTVTKGSVNATSSQCKKAKCACIPGNELCGQSGSIDLTEWFTSPDGPQGDSTFECEEPKIPGGDRVCSFSEKNMNSLISLGFGDAKIFLNCANSGECTHPSRLPGYEAPSSSAPLSTVAIVFISLGGLALLAAAAFGIWWIKKTQNQGMDAAVPLADDAARREQEANLMAHHTPCTLTFHNVSYVIEQHNPVIKKKLSKVQKKYRSESAERTSGAGTGPEPTRLEEGAVPSNTNIPLTILQNIQGMVKEGQVMAIMGGSGAGKTTFLDILARKNKRGVVSGEIRVNGQVMGLEEYRSIIGYVDQEDTLMDTLTVYETILYSALLRLPRKMTLANKKLRVHETMEELGILKIADRFIGSSGM